MPVMTASMTVDDRFALITSFSHVVKRISNRYHVKRSGLISMEDIVQAGWVGVINAVDHCSNLSTLRAYVERKVEGAIKDYFREIDVLSRAHRKRIKDGWEKFSTAASPANLTNLISVPASQLDDLIIKERNGVLRAVLEERKNKSKNGKPPKPPLNTKTNSKPNSSNPHSDNKYKISARELQVLHCIAKGLNTPEISKVLSLSVKTVDVHIYSLRIKLNMKRISRVEMILECIRRKIIIVPGLVSIGDLSSNYYRSASTTDNTILPGWKERKEYRPLVPPLPIPSTPNIPS